MDDFIYSQKGLTRFPPNVEQILIERESTVTWLIARRNDVVLRFPLNRDDCRQLVDLLTCPDETNETDIRPSKLRAASGV
ncbi:MAG: hypothetical protein L0287_15220 [Anaerolineae bacterium]|nr:hypothetical protein [Anaerolineae bacterium]